MGIKFDHKKIAKWIRNITSQEWREMDESVSKKQSSIVWHEKFNEKWHLMVYSKFYFYFLTCHLKFRDEIFHIFYTQHGKIDKTLFTNWVSRWACGCRNIVWIAKDPIHYRIHFHLSFNLVLCFNGLSVTFFTVSVHILYRMYTI